MKIDLASLLTQAQEEVNNSEKKGNESGLPVVYPGEAGKIVFRILYNVKSGTIQRKIIRHDKTACMSVYGEECPICKAINEAETVKGKECGAFGKYGYKTRGFCIAKITDADSAYLSRVKVGDTVIMMYPKTVYESINRIIIDAGKNNSLESLVCDNTGIPIVIENIQKAGAFPEYNTHLFPYGPQKLFTGDDGEKQFDELLDSLPSLSDLIIPSKPTDEVRKECKSKAETIIQEYIYGNIVNPNDNGFVPVPEGNDEVPFMNEPTTQTSGNPQFDPTPNKEDNTNTSSNTNSTAPNGYPDCFGNHSADDNKCAICVCEAECYMKKNRG